MKYTVVWKRSADDTLIELWMNATDRDAISRAVRQIETQLRVAPLDVGESREENYRILCILPVVVAYRISQEDCLVTVVQIRTV